MKIINFGSLNIDRVYMVDHLARPGETITSNQYNIHAGGKGLNQSIAMARAGADVCHAGKIGEDGLFLKDLLNENGIDVSRIFTTTDPTGHAVIQVDSKAENSIILFGGANRTITDDEIDRVFEGTQAGDYLLLQNEINNIKGIVAEAIARDVRIILNPAPITPDIAELPLGKLQWLVVNEVEGEMISGEKTPEGILNQLTGQYPQLSVLLTLGSAGAWYAGKNDRFFVPAQKVEAIDTTGAGDTFIGYFVAEMIQGIAVANAMTIATQAAAICVTRHGAAESIPARSELIP